MFGRRSGTSENVTVLRQGGAPHDIASLVLAARAGDDAAWHALVRYLTPVVRRIARGHRLAEGDVDDVAQTVWLRLFEHLDRIKEPCAVPKWVMTTARRESLNLVGGGPRLVSIDALTDDGSEPAEHVEIDLDVLRSEQAGVVRQGLAELPRTQRDVLLLLSAEPPVSYREISRRLGIPIGSIGPMRARGLERLRTNVAVRAYVGSRDPRPTRRARTA